MDIKVRDLKQTETIENENKLMVLVDDDLNLVKNITKEEFLINVISSTENNALVQESDGNLYVNTSEIADSVQALDDKFTEQIGDLSDLTTEDKTNLVAAINEAATKGGGGSTLFEFKWCDHLLNNISWLRADTFSWQSGDVHTSAYNHLVQDIQGITAETETIGSYTVTFYRATDGHKICLADQEQTVLNIYNTYGIAWYYILDTTNTQFKLPRTKYGFEGLRTNVGDKIDESLPNIKGEYGHLYSNNDFYSGVFSSSSHNSLNINYNANGSGLGWNNISFNASRSSSTYQNNAPVQERATQMYLYFYVGDYSQTAIEQTAGLNAELFNNKVDLNFDNMNPSQTAKDTIISWGMPDFSSRITIPYNTSIQLPCDAVVYHEDYSDTYTAYCRTDISLDGTNWVTIGNWGWTCMGSSYTVLPKGIYVKCSGKSSANHVAWYAPLKGTSSNNTSSSGTLDGGITPDPHEDGSGFEFE